MGTKDELRVGVKEFKGDSRGVEGSFKGIREHFMGLYRIFQRCFKESLCFFSDCLQAVLFLTDSFKEDTRCFRKVLSVSKFQGCFKSVSRRKANFK